MFQASTTLFEKKLWWQVEKNGIPMEEEEEEEVSERKQIFFVVKNLGLDPGSATAWIQIWIQWIRIRNTGPAMKFRIVALEFTLLSSKLFL